MLCTSRYMFLAGIKVLAPLIMLPAACEDTIYGIL